mgnify:CR=1 FL=1
MPLTYEQAVEAGKIAASIAEISKPIIPLKTTSPLGAVIKNIVITFAGAKEGQLIFEQPIDNSGSDALYKALWPLFEDQLAALNAQLGKLG